MFKGRHKQQVNGDVVVKGAVGGKGTASVVSASPKSQQRMELSSLKRIIREDKTDKARAIIAVVKPSAVPELEHKLKSKWKFWSAKTTVRVATLRSLQSTIDLVQADKSAPRNLTILAGQDVNALDFKVGSNIRTLSIFRHEDPNLGVPAGTLLISGASTYAKTRLDQWGAKEHQNHAIYLGRGVGIRIESDVLNDPAYNRGGASAPQSSSPPTGRELQRRDTSASKKLAAGGGSGWGGGWGDAYSLTLTNADKGEVYELFNSLHSTQEGEEKHQGPWWERWQKPIGTIIGILTGAKSAQTMRATAGGVFVEYHFGAAALSFGGSGIPHAITLAAGPASLLGLGAAAAVYFVPWEAIFKWLWGVIRKMFQSFLDVWERLMRWVASKLSMSSDGKAGSHGPPMPSMNFG